MSRLLCLVLAAGLLVGCNSDHPPDSSASARHSDSQMAGAQAANPSKRLYFEMNQNGKTYVFGHMQTLQRIRAGQQVPNLVTKDGLGPNGESVVFESDGAGLEKSLEEQYIKNHPKD